MKKDKIKNFSNLQITKLQAQSIKGGKMDYDAIDGAPEDNE